MTQSNRRGAPTKLQVVLPGILGSEAECFWSFESPCNSGSRDCSFSRRRLRPPLRCESMRVYEANRPLLSDQTRKCLGVAATPPSDCGARLANPRLDSAQIVRRAGTPHTPDTDLDPKCCLGVWSQGGRVGKRSAREAPEPNTARTTLEHEGHGAQVYTLCVAARCSTSQAGEQIRNRNPLKTRAEDPCGLGDKCRCALPTRPHPSRRTFSAGQHRRRRSALC